jgi:hypothetical protein
VIMSICEFRVEVRELCGAFKSVQLVESLSAGSSGKNRSGAKTVPCATHPAQKHMTNGERTSAFEPVSIV